MCASKFVWCDKVDVINEVCVCVCVCVCVSVQKQGESNMAS